MIALDRDDAMFDLRDAAVAVDGDRVLAVTRIGRDLIDLSVLIESWMISADAWHDCGGGTDPVMVLEDCSDPEALANLIVSYHDYPDLVSADGMVC